jgi:hypothetical protein
MAMNDMRSRLRGASEQVTLPEQAFERMAERRERKRRTARVASAAVALAFAVVFVGGTMALLSGLASDRAQLRSGGPGEDGPPSSHDTVIGGPFDEERIARENDEVREYVSCMRDRGWSLPEPEVWVGPPHPGLLDPPVAIPDEPEAADRYFRDSGTCGVRFEDDRDKPSSAGASGDSEYDEARIAEENREVREYMSCMRERGWILPEPQVWEGPPHPGLLDPPVGSVPDEPEAAARYFRDSAECGVEYWDESGNLLPAEG